MRQPLTVVVLSLVAAAAAPGAAPQRPGGQGGPGGPGGFGPPGMGQERKIVAQFDKDGDKRLSTDERKAARAFLESQPAMGPGRGPGGPGGRGGPGGGMEAGTPGAKLSPSDVKP